MILKKTKKQNFIFFLFNFLYMVFFSVLKENNILSSANMERSGSKLLGFERVRKRAVEVQWGPLHRQQPAVCQGLQM